MPRIRVEEHLIPVSIPAMPVCPRCLDIEPGVPGGDPNDPHTGPFAEDLCGPCGRVVQKEQMATKFLGTFPPCVRCDKDAGCFGETLCIECYRSDQKAKDEAWKTKPLAPHAIAARPMRVHPRPGYDGPVDGPLRMAHGPRDYEGQGREAFWDQTPEERATNLKTMVADANVNCAGRVDLAHLGTASENKAFAKGWLAELSRAARAKE